MVHHISFNKVCFEVVDVRKIFARKSFPENSLIFPDCVGLFRLAVKRLGRHLGSRGLVAEREAGQRTTGGGSSYSVFGCSATAQQKPLLADLGITHVLNAADGPQHIDTGPQFYSDVGLKYHGVPAADRRDFDLAPYFGPAADFIHEALSQRGANTRGSRATLLLFLLSCAKTKHWCNKHTR